MRWFGTHWGAAICNDTPHAPTPIGEACLWCDEPITAEDSGLLTPHLSEHGTMERASHMECQLRQIIGGLNHLMGKCTCCGGILPPDPPGLSPREAARVAVEYWRRQR